MPKVPDGSNVPVKPKPKFQSHAGNLMPGILNSLIAGTSVHRSAFPDRCEFVFEYDPD